MRGHPKGLMMGHAETVQRRAREEGARAFEYGADFYLSEAIRRF